MKGFKVDFQLILVYQIFFCMTNWSVAFPSKAFQRFLWNFLLSWDRKSVFFFLLFGHLACQVVTMLWTKIVDWDGKSWLVWQLEGKFVHLFSSDNDLVLFHLWWRETMPNAKRSPHILSKIADLVTFKLQTKWWWHFLNPSYTNKDTRKLFAPSKLCDTNYVIK